MAARNLEADFDAVIVGAGFGGLYMLHRLRGMGFKARVLEAGSGVGGTWYWNRYPGARCDVESVQYSYQFDGGLQQEWDWTERYAAQPELLRYANHVADRFDLRRDIEFNTRVKAAAFDEAQARWVVETEAASASRQPTASWRRDACPRPNLPQFKGLEMPSRAIATTRDTGPRRASTSRASGSPSSARAPPPCSRSPSSPRRPTHLTVFQRTANYAVPAHNRAARPRLHRQGQGRLSGHARPRQADHDRHRLRLFRSGGARDLARGAHARVRAALAARRAVVPRRLQGPDGRCRRPTTRARSSCAPRSARACATPALPSCCRRRTPSAASGCASTSATTRRSTGRT